MKNLKYIFLLVSFSGYSQASLIVEYDVHLNTLERKGFLHVSEKNVHYYYELTNGDGDKSKMSEKDGVQLLNRTINPSEDEKRVQTYSATKDTLFNVDYLDSKPIIYYEIVKKIEWQITIETRIIANYPCVKAKGNVRGRNYVAWFTSEIPAQNGPWKFNNLPGLILQISDESSSFVWSASKVTFTENSDNYYLDSTLELMSQKEFETENEAEKDEESSVFILKLLDRGAVLVGSKSNRGRELVYDWEK